MSPLAQWPLEMRQHLIGVFTDIDDTLTTEGAITSDALAALGALRAAGLHLIAITGRSVGWSEAFALQWLLDAIVAENGAVALVPAPVPGGLRRLYRQDTAARAANMARMQQVARQILDEVAGATLARDSAGRETDIAIDHSEFARLPAEGIDQVVRLMHGAGMHATVSSIHVNGWYGDHSKLSGARWMVRELYGRKLDDETDRWVAVGDSANDELLFRHVAHSVGVANIRRFAAVLKHPPRYVTAGERGAGFAQLAQAVLQGQKRL